MSARRGVVSNCEWVERILRGHADTGCADAGWQILIRPDVRLTEGRGRQTACPELTEIQEIAEHGQVLVTDISIERTIQVLAISWRHFRGQIREIEQRALPWNSSAKPGGVLSIVELIGRCVRRWRLQIQMKRSDRQALEYPASHAASKVTAAPVSICLNTSTVRVMRKIYIARKNRGCVVEARVNHDVCFVIAGTCEQVGRFFPSVVGETKIRVAIAGVNLQPAELVN